MAAPHQRTRKSLSPQVPLAVRLRVSDLRERVRESRVASQLLFLVDASGSMAAERRMQAVKGAVLAMLVDAYQKRDRVVCGLPGSDAQLVLPPTNSIDLAHRALQYLPVGGRTPLALGLKRSHDLLSAAPGSRLRSIPRGGNRRASQRRPRWRRSVRGGGAFRIAEEVRGAGILGLVLDTERDFQDSASVTARGKLSADYVRLDDLQAGSCMTRFVLTGASDAAGRRRP